MIKEAGEVEEKIVVNELFAEMTNQVRNASSVEGLRQMVSFPYTMVRDLALRIRIANHRSEGTNSKQVEETG
jgi:hypothetical protein